MLQWWLQLFQCNVTIITQIYRCTPSIRITVSFLLRHVLIQRILLASFMLHMCKRLTKAGRFSVGYLSVISSISFVHGMPNFSFLLSLSTFFFLAIVG